MTITWRPLTVCSYGDGAMKRYEAWDKRGAWSTLMATGLKSPDEANGAVLAEIERAGL